MKVDGLGISVKEQEVKVAMPHMKIEAPTVKINGKVADANLRIATVKAPRVELST